jgi:hypothetical protein
MLRTKRKCADIERLINNVRRISKISEEFPAIRKKTKKMETVISIYIAGKITGESYLTAYNKFESVEKMLQIQGYKVINPMKLCKASWNWIHCMSVCLYNLVRKADAIYMLPDWKDSTGAKTEYKTAKLFNIKIYHHEHR